MLLAINISTFTQFRWSYSCPCSPNEVTRETWSDKYKCRPVCLW